MGMLTANSEEREFLLKMQFLLEKQSFSNAKVLAPL
jgi:hypothetical protein